VTEFNPLPREFYLPSAKVVAPRLLGHYLLRRIPHGLAGGPIVETEAYIENDPACHGYIGPTNRNRVMFGPPGRAYVYLIYGFYNCFGVLEIQDLPPSAVDVLGNSSSQRINAMVTDVVTETLEGGLTEIRMSDRILQATLDLREFLFTAVYENPRATAEFEKATGLLGGLWEKVRQRPEDFLDRVTIDSEGLDAAARDFIAGMTDRYAVALFEDLFVPRSWNV
jgi:hypothetical protein